MVRKYSIEDIKKLVADLDRKDTKRTFSQGYAFGRKEGREELIRQLELMDTEPREYHVTYYYLATGMEGHADMRDYGRYKARSKSEAIELAIENKLSRETEEVKHFVRSCLSAREV